MTCRSGVENDHISRSSFIVRFVPACKGTHSVGGGEVDAEASGSRTEQEDEDVRPAGVERRQKGNEEARNNYCYL